MKESIGFTFTLNIVIVFIFIAFAILMGIMSYSKAYRINSKIIGAIEKCEGYNQCAESEIDRILSTIGYKAAESECKMRENVESEKRLDNYDYCVYKINDKTKKDEIYYYDRYGIVTYMVIEFPIVDRIRIPIYNRSDWIYRFPNDRK